MPSPETGYINKLKQNNSKENKNLLNKP